MNNIEVDFAVSENRNLVDKNGFHLACVSPMDCHKTHIFIHLFYFYNKEVFKHLKEHVDMLLTPPRKDKTDMIADYLLKKYSK